ncbi:MAG: Bug family tripartite tricarboxylate transporter substrate binding protein [Janthinobacterium lividum]
MKRLLAIAACCLSLAAGLGAPGALAQDYPTRFITVVVPFAAGSGSDTAARVVGQYLGPRLGQSVVVENRVGATGAIASTYVARAKPDGYTLLLGTNSTHGSNSALYKSLTYDPVKNFAGVADTGVFNYFLVVNPALPIKSVPELVAYAKANPGKLSYAGGSSTSIVMAETFAKETGSGILKVPYRSNPPALTDVIAGRVSLMFVDVSSAISFVKSGQLRALAVTTKARSPLYPDLPTVDETAVKGFNLASWTGLFAPAGTPAPVVQRLNQEVNAVLALPEVKERLASLGVETDPMSAAQFNAFAAAEVTKWARLVKDAGIEPE